MRSIRKVNDKTWKYSNTPLLISNQRYLTTYCQPTAVNFEQRNLQTNDIIHTPLGCRDGQRQPTPRIRESGTRTRFQGSHGNGTSISGTSAESPTKTWTRDKTIWDDERLSETTTDVGAKEYQASAKCHQRSKMIRRPAGGGRQAQQSITVNCISNWYHNP